MKTKFLTLFWIMTTGISMTALSQEKEYFGPDISAVTMMQPGQELGYPICHINGAIQLSFDVIDDKYPDLSYTIKHCDADFVPDDLDFGEYAEGFNNRYLEDYKGSFNTNTSYTHYTLTIPNNDLRLTISGNYIVNIYESDNPENILLTKRFMVYEDEDNTKLDISIDQPFLPQFCLTHQQISVTFNNQKLNIANPAKYLKIYAMQNGNMNSRKALELSGFMNNYILYHQNDSTNLFMGLSEYDFMDAKDVHFRPLGVDAITYANKRYSYHLSARDFSENYTSRGDINGQFYIKNDRGYERDLESDYINATFRFRYDRFAEEKIYIYGALSNYQLSEDYQLSYNPDTELWEKTITLKQGLYNYLYAIATPEGEIINFSSGNHFNTSNDYIVAVYTTLTKNRGDRLIMCKIAKK